MAWLSSLFKAFGSAVDAAVPVAVGSRTQLAVLLGVAAKTARPFVPAEYQALCDGVASICASLTPAFAAAGVVRK
jgi:hypothetical protein